MLPAAIEVIGVELAGRGARWNEPLASDIRAAAASLVPEIERATAGPFALFGHSMGALLAYELALRLDHVPTKLIVSACPAPHRIPGCPQKHRMSDDGLLREIGRLNGTPPQVLQDRDLMDAMLRIIRMDLAMFETYQPQSDVKLQCGIMVLSGDHDAIIRKSDLWAWSDYTAAEFSLEVFPGDHFYFRTSANQVLPRIAHNVLGTTLAWADFGERRASL